jgi:predicted ester cyclase
MIMLPLQGCISTSQEPNLNEYQVQEQLERDNKKLITTLIYEVVNNEKFELVDTLMSDSLVEHDALQQPGNTPKEAFISAVLSFKKGFPDSKMYIDYQIADGEFVVPRWHMLGKHTGPFMNINPQGKSVHVTGMFFDRVINGKVVETWAEYNLIGLMSQIK